MRLARAFAAFWWDFVVGDEWRVAVIVGAAAVAGGLAASQRWAGGEAIACVLAAGVMLVVSALLVISGRARRAPAGD